MEISNPISLFLYYVFCPLLSPSILDPLIISIFYFSSHLSHYYLSLIYHQTPGWKSPCRSSRDSAQPERPHRDPQHPPSAEEPGCAG